jgi:hypothetical protein
MFAGKPPSSSDATKRFCQGVGSVLDALRRLLLQIGGANIASADRALQAAAFLTRSQTKSVSTRSLVQDSGARSIAVRDICRLRTVSGRMRAVVALQIHGVSEPTRRTLSAEARARGESLQEFLLELLEREAQQIDGRGLLEVEPARLVKLIQSETEGREVQLAHGC